MKLKDSSIKSFEPADKVVKHSDGAGLCLLVHPSGKKTWVYIYRFNSKQTKITLGQYPHISLKEARKARQEARALLDQGIDPRIRKQEAEKEHNKNIFSDVAEDWLTIYREDHAPKSISIYRSILDTHVLPKLGGIPIAEIKRTQLVDLVKGNTLFKTTKDRSQIKGKMAASMAQKTCFCLGLIFKHALNLGLIEYSIASQLSTVLPDPEYSNHRTVIKIDDVKILLQSIRSPGYATISIWYFLNIMPYVFVRNSELRCATWSEFDLNTGEWYIPGERMKGKILDKLNKPPHFVPLAKQVIELLKELRQESTSDYLFPSIYNKNRCITDAAPLVALKRFGIFQTVHGFRTIASTHLHEMNYPTHIIEMQMAHKDDNKVRATYNKAEYKEERVKMMQEWADYLDNLADSK